MKIQENIPLSALTTMRIGGRAQFVIELHEPDDVPAAINFAHERRLPWFVLGGGSNVIADESYDGVIILNRIHGFKEISSDASGAIYQIGAGENWDETVARLVAQNLSGAEFLSAIPGVAGATPVQNVGAYGAEISQLLIELTAYNVATGKFEKLTNADCHFSYRNSIFKPQIDRKYIITYITLRLSRTSARPPFYNSLQKYLLAKHPELARNDHEFRDNISFTPAEIRRAVIEIRHYKLPDPAQIPSAGSFFKNPIVDAETARQLLARFPDAPHFPAPDNQVKLAAGWLIDQTGLKGFTDDGLQIYPKNALVVTNIAEHNSVDNLAKFRAEIIAKVHDKFGLTLEQEPENL